MQDADYFRSQAEMYFKLARLMSVRSDAAIFRAEAEHCLAHAVELEGPATAAWPLTSSVVVSKRMKES